MEYINVDCLQSYKFCKLLLLKYLKGAKKQIRHIFRKLLTKMNYIKNFENS